MWMSAATSIRPGLCQHPRQRRPAEARFAGPGGDRIRLQGLVAKSVVLKYTPTLKFVVDDSIVRGNRVLQIIDELDKSSAAKRRNHLSREKLSENH